jgi:hypothetical protein
MAAAVWQPQYGNRSMAAAVRQPRYGSRGTAAAVRLIAVSPVLTACYCYINLWWGRLAGAPPSEKAQNVHLLCYRFTDRPSVTVRPLK